MSNVPPLYRTDYMRKSCKLWLYCREVIMVDLEAYANVAMDTFTKAWKSDKNFERQQCFAESMICFLLVPGKARKYLIASKPTFASRRKTPEQQWKSLKLEIIEDYTRSSQGIPPQSHYLPTPDGEIWRIMKWILHTLVRLPEERPLKRELLPIWAELAGHIGAKSFKAAACKSAPKSQVSTTS